MSVFVDSSALIATLVAEDIKHSSAATFWSEMIQRDQQLVTSNYIVLETCSLLHRRVGLYAVRRLLEDLLPSILVEWVDVPTHQAGIYSLLVSSRGGPSLVDCVSFVAMRRLGIKTAFTFDNHFREQGFDCRP